MGKKHIFVTGYFGAPIQEEARRIASSRGWPICDLDAAIAASDGRSIAKLCMMGGEHAYRNAEYEQVRDLCDGSTEAEHMVVLCGDGILYDEDTRRLMTDHALVIAGEDQPLEELWAGARKQEDTWHAFMKFGSEEEKRAAFEGYIQRQRALFAQVREDRKAAEIKGAL